MHILKLVLPKSSCFSDGTPTLSLSIAPIIFLTFYFAIFDDLRCTYSDETGETTSLVQTIAVLQKRGLGDTARIDLPIVAAAHVHVAEASFVQGITHEPAFHEGVPYDPGFNVQNGLSTKYGHYRTSEEVLLVCMAVIVAVSIGWFAFWIRTRNNESVPFLKLVLCIASFGICSWGMFVVNKSLVISLGSPTLITAVQMSMCAVGVLLLAYSELKGDPMQMLKWSIVPCIYTCMLVSSFYTFKYLTLSMFMIVRNMGPAVTLPIECVVIPADKRPYVTIQMLLALGVILIGTCVYCGHIEVSYHGLALAFFNMILAAVGNIAQRRLLTRECQGLTTETCMLLNNTVGVVPALILAYFWGEYQQVDLHRWFLSSATFLLLLSGIIGTGICYFGITVAREISATSFMVLQSVVRVAVAAVGVVIFFDPLGWPFQVIGGSLSFLGALWYGKAQIDGFNQSEFDGQATAPNESQEEPQEEPKANPEGMQVKEVPRKGKKMLEGNET